MNEEEEKRMYVDFFLVNVLLIELESGLVRILINILSSVDVIRL